MNTRVLVASALALTILAPAAANALTINNQDKQAYTLKIYPTGGKEMDVKVQASASADVDCKAGCKVMLGHKEQTVDAKTAKLVIKGGKLVL